MDGWMGIGMKDVVVLCFGTRKEKRRFVVE